MAVAASSGSPSSRSSTRSATCAWSILPVIIALLATTLLLPPRRWLSRLGLPDAAAVAATMVGALLVLVAIGAAVAPSIGGQARTSAAACRTACARSPGCCRDAFNLSRAELDQRVNEGLDTLRANSGRLTHGSRAAPSCSASS